MGLSRGLSSESPYNRIKNVNIIIENMKNLMGKSEPESEGKGLKIMTPNQLLARFPILLAQKKQEIIVKS